jgi:DNA-binding NtrC family response regulator
MASVLIVDDDESDLLLLQSMLEEEHEIHVAKSGEEALKVYLRNSIDVVVTDIQMPHGDGIELITALKGFDAEVAIVAISGQKPHKLGIAQMAGARHILSKPVSPQRLLEAVSLARQRRDEGRAETG